MVFNINKRITKESRYCRSERNEKIASLNHSQMNLKTVENTSLLHLMIPIVASRILVRVDLIRDF